MSTHTRIIGEVKDEEKTGFLFTAIVNRKKTKECRTIPSDPKTQQTCKWTTFLPENVEKIYTNGNNLSILIHNGGGGFREYKVTHTTVYPYFDTMLEKEGAETCIPGKTKEEALKLYGTFYKDPSKISRVVCIHLGEEIITNQEGLEQFLEEIRNKDK